MVVISERPGTLAVIPIVAALVITFVATYYTLRGGHYIKRAFGVSGMTMFQRVMGLLLASLAVQFMVEGGRRLLSPL